MSDIKKTERTRVKRLPARGHYDAETINAILDTALIAHVGFQLEGAPAVIPTACWREGKTLYIHGSSKNGMMRALQNGEPACVCVTHLDGLVLARSAFHHSMNYRSVVIFGAMHEVTDQTDKMERLRIFTDRIAPGRWSDIKVPTKQELKATMVLGIPIAEASAKIRSGPPVDDEPDYALPVWAGVVPVGLVAGEPEPDPKLPAGTPIPDHARHFKNIVE